MVSCTVMSTACPARASGSPPELSDTEAARNDEVWTGRLGTTVRSSTRHSPGHACVSVSTIHRPLSPASPGLTWIWLSVNDSSPSRSAMPRCPGVVSVICPPMSSASMVSGLYETLGAALKPASVWMPANWKAYCGGSVMRIRPMPFVGSGLESEKLVCIETSLKASYEERTMEVPRSEAGRRGRLSRRASPSTPSPLGSLVSTWNGASAPLYRGFRIPSSESWSVLPPGISMLSAEVFCHECEPGIRA
mmetsp:Transcript_56739/g.133605  ORF Transcript_56739/g.133605 Transcript_56739/m.133605 type:complete len:249 (-) Transcript_56739:34-780(-)